MRFAIKLFILSSLLLLPLACNAQTPSQAETFTAQVVEILDEKELIREDGSSNLQQNLKLKGLNGQWKNKEIIFNGISELDVISSSVYQVGDKVITVHSNNGEEDIFYITDHVRYHKIYWLILIFAILVILIGRWKGLRALISLGISFLIIINFILPNILAGKSPLLIGVIGSFFILTFIIYLTEGLNTKAHLAVTSIIICLTIVGILSVIFTSLTRLTGMASEEILFLIDLGKGTINFSGLLLAGILIGSLGVMDDVAINQIESVAQLKTANPKLSKQKLLNMSLKIGNAHMGAMINTLFLAYAGAALPLLLLFSVKQEPFLTISQIINNEIIAIEIIRTLIGSIGIIIAMPIATILAVNFLTIDTNKTKE